jgi:hypothetical protein
MKPKFNECNIVDPNYAKMQIKRRQKSMTSRWGIIHAVGKKFHGYFKNICATPASRSNTEGKVSDQLSQFGILANPVF